MTIERDRAIVVGRSRGGGESRVLTFLTSGHGRVKLYYRLFPRRLRREFLDTLQCGELLYTPATASRPGRLHSFDCEEVWPPVREDFDRLVHALHFAALAGHVAPEGEASGDIFELLKNSLDQLSRPGDPEALRVVFELKLLKVSGFEPSLERCYSCLRPVVTEGASFSARGGGVVCEECLAVRRDPVQRLSGGSLALLRKALVISADRAGRLRIGAELKKEIFPLMEETVSLALECPSPSADFLNGPAVRGRPGRRTSL